MNLLIGTMLLAAALGTTYDETGDEVSQEPDAIPRIRPTDPVLAAAVAQATALSPTFRRLAEAIQATDGIVYIQRDTCGGGSTGCLLFAAMSGSNRILHIRVNPAKSAFDTGTIGHELQHALEVLRNPMVRSAESMLLYYMRVGISGGMNSRFRETAAAITAGNAVRSELRNATRAALQGRADVTEITPSR